jgi:hypothetical protein
MNKYTITSVKFEGCVTVGYKEKVLGFVDCSNAAVTEEQQKFLVQNVPLEEEALQRFINSYKTLSCAFIPEDLSFERFWNEYKNKVGNTKRAKKLWSELSEADKIKVFEAIPKYRSYLQRNPNLTMLYPETFLFQRRFENQYR